MTKPPPLRDVIARHGLSTRASLGQHYLLDYNLTRRIAHAAGPLANIQVIEIGPGPGGLTRALLETDAARVVAIERDRRFVPALAELAEEYPDRLDIVEADALAIDPTDFADAPRKIIANLPYNISTRLLTDWLEKADSYLGMTLMFQTEVALRLAAAPGNKDYGRLSVLTQWLCEVGLAFDISPTAFTPPPKVGSTVVQLTPRAQPAYPADRATLTRVTAAAFGQRRKMLRSSLKQISDNPKQLLGEAGVDATARAEQLSIKEYCAIARTLTALSLKPPPDK